MGGEELSDAERDQLLELCRQRLDAFRMQRGEETGCLLTQKPAASATAAATAPRSAARSKSGHGADGLAMHQPEWNAVVELLKLRWEELSAQDALINGWAGAS